MREAIMAKEKAPKEPSSEYKEKEKPRNIDLP